MKDFLNQLPMCCKDMTEIPNADSFARPRKKEMLSKLTGKGWLYSGSWKKRFCVLDGSKFYFFENERSKGSEKLSGVINLDYYDVCEEYDTKDKKNPHVFIIGTSVRGFFDNRHQFAAASESDMQDWIRSVHDVIAEARNVRSRAGKNRIASVNNDDQMADDLGDPNFNTEEPEQLITATKDRVRGPQGRRLPQRKSMMPAGSPTEDLPKQRSFSLTSPKEQDEESESSTNDGRKISLSMDAVDRDEKMEADEMNSPRSSSSYEISSKRLSVDSKRADPTGNTSAKKGAFGKLGGQHAALTKELELKLKSGLTPGGRRLQVQDPAEEEEEMNSAQEILDLNKKINQQDIDLTGVKTRLEALSQRVEDISANSRSNTEHNQSYMSQVHDILSDTAATLKEVHESNSQCERILDELRQTKVEHHRLLEECKECLTLFRAIQLPSSEEEEIEPTLV